MDDKRKRLPLPPIKRGDIYYADLSPVLGSEQGGIRPIVVIQNNMGNRYSPTIIAAAITSQMEKNLLPTHIEFQATSVGLHGEAVVLAEQLRTLDRKRLRGYVGHLDDETIQRIDEALLVSLGLDVAKKD